MKNLREKLDETGFTMGVGFWEISNHTAHEGVIFENGIDGAGLWNKIIVETTLTDATTRHKKIKITLHSKEEGGSAGSDSQIWVTDDHVIIPHQYNTVIVVWDGDEHSTPILKVNGSAINMTNTGQTFWPGNLNRIMQTNANYGDMVI